MVHMGAAAAASRYGIGRFVRVQAPIDLADFRAFYVEAQGFGDARREGVFPGFDVFIFMFVI